MKSDYGQLVHSKCAIYRECGSLVQRIENPKKFFAYLGIIATTTLLIGQNSIYSSEVEPGIGFVNPAITSATSIPDGLSFSKPTQKKLSNHFSFDSVEKRSHKSFTLGDYSFVKAEHHHNNIYTSLLYQNGCR